MRQLKMYKDNLGQFGKDGQNISEAHSMLKKKKNSATYDTLFKAR